MTTIFDHHNAFSPWKVYLQSHVSLNSVFVMGKNINKLILILILYIYIYIYIYIYLFIYKNDIQMGFTYIAIMT
jgi:hypothetical protein